MSWTSWQAFVEMGGQGRFVWGSVGAVALGLLVEWVRLQRLDAQRRTELRQRWLQADGDDVEPHHLFDDAFHERGRS